MGKLRIVSHSADPFTGRVEAGGLLARELKNYRGERTVALGIPRGGIVIAREVSREINAALDIVLSRKLGAPGNPELAIGAVSEDGKLFLHDTVTASIAESPYIKAEMARQMEEIARRVKVYRTARPKEVLKGRKVIIMDDGLATGATMQAAIWAARQEGAKNVIVAVPVAPEDTARKLARDAEELIVLRVPPFFAAVGQFYSQFDQVSDEEVIAILKEEYGRGLSVE